MRHFWSELRRELRWALNSKVILALMLAVVAASGWNAVSNASYAAGEANYYRSTVEQYEQAGVSIDAMLEAPMSVETGDDGSETTDNPVRYDYERAARAFGNASAVGGASSAIALATVLFVPALGLMLGVGLATHDVRSRSLRVRWPQTGLVGFVSAKVAALLLLLVVTCGALAAVSAAAGVATPLFMSESAGDAGVTPEPATFDGASMLAALYLPLVGALFGLVGFAIASWLRERAFTMTALLLAYFLVPILGPFDPRNLILLAGRDILAFTGSFRPVAVTGPDALLSFGLLGVLAFIAFGVSAAAWSARAKW